MIFRAFLLASLLSPPAAALADDDEGGDDGDSGGDDGGDDSDSESDDGNDDANEDTSSSDDHAGSSGSRSDDDSATWPARGTLDHSDALRAVREGRAMPLRTALKKVAGRYQGAVIDVALSSNGHRLEYRFKLRTDRGTIRTVRMDAKTGRFLGLGALFR